MPENYSGRVALIVTVLLVMLAGVFSPVLEKIRHPSEKITNYIALRPGIDMVGGTSLVYQIKTPPGQPYDPELATKVASSLKKRVDPYGEMNLVWRPEGADRLEIQMPSSGSDDGGAKAAGDALIAAEHALEATNLSVTDAIDAVEQKNGHTRAEFEKLAQGYPKRLDLLNKAAAAFDALTALTAKPINERNPLEEAKLRQAYEQQKAALATTDFDVNRFREDLSDKNGHDTWLSAARKQQADFPARLQAIDNYAIAVANYEKQKSAVDNTTDLKRMLRGSGVLEYHILVTAGDDPTKITRMMDRMKPDGPGPALQSGDEMRWFAIDSGATATEKFAGDILATYHGKTYVLAWITADKSVDHREGQKNWALTDARTAPGQNGADVVAFSFDPQGASYFGTLTENNINRPLAIVLDGKIISAPNINARISSSGIIEGGRDGFSRTELNYLVNTLSAGSLPAQLEDEPISERHVEAELGHANLVHGLLACVVGVAVVGLFLISYYYVAGVVAFFAVVMNLLIVLAVMSFLGATFTLPSIAGIVLSVGTAVDANVLIFERLREEQHRGLSLRMALRNAYDKAFSAIIDSNATTFITSVFLIWKGTEEVKGFGITLVIGIVASLFTALFVTRTIFGLLIDKGIIKDLRSLPLTFPKWDKLLRPNIDWMSYAWVFYSFSAIAVGIGLILFGIKVHQRQMFDIEFAGGTSVQFDLNHPMSKDDLTKQVQNSDKEVLKSANPVAQGSAVEGNKYTSFNLLAPSTDAVAVRDAVIAVLRNDLKLELPSGFDGAGPGGTAAALDTVLGKQVLAVSDDTKWPQGANAQVFRPDSWAEYKGGVAIVLSHLDPPLTPAQITERINRQSLQSGAQRRPFTVESPNGLGHATDLAIVLSKDPKITADKDVKQFDDMVAGPMWRAVVEGVDRPAQLKEVRNFDAQVAGDAQTNAIVALVLSIAVIMVYIWVRFGNLKYGTATMVALLHDTIFTIAALGFAHFLSDVPVIKQLFQLEPFRINLTVVAGILTIMGYSMIDTIVVFDRIRENRGKFGLVSRKTINDAVNQTLSRTLLTAGTTTVTVGIMYFLGGEGIHGFTFVLLIGILVGTYSSVAIAAPILLIGNKNADVSSPGTLQKGAMSTSRA